MRGEDEVFVPDYSEDDRRILGEFALWSLQRLSSNETTVLDCPVLGRAVFDRVSYLVDSHLRQRECDDRAGIPGRSDVFEEVAKEFPSEDPVLLCWRVWWIKRSSTLARTDILSPYPPRS